MGPYSPGSSQDERTTEGLRECLWPCPGCKDNIESAFAGIVERLVILDAPRQVDDRMKKAVDLVSDATCELAYRRHSLLPDLTRLTLFALSDVGHDAPKASKRCSLPECSPLISTETG